MPKYRNRTAEGDRAEFMQRVHANIMGSHHIHLTGVFKTAADDPTKPDFTYTTGLWSYGFPELIIVGMPYPFSGHILNGLAKHQIEHNYVFVDGEVFMDERIASQPLKFHECSPGPDDVGYMGVSHEYYDERVPGLQVLWCDPQGRFPGDAGYAPWKPGVTRSPDELQPLLPSR